MAQDRRHLLPDAEGYYWYCGRSDDMLKVGGLWVSPIEIENTLMEHPAVPEAAVIGSQDADGLIKPKAYVLLKSEFTASVQLQTDLQSHVKSKLAPYKYPRWRSLSTTCPRRLPGKSKDFAYARKTDENWPANKENQCLASRS